MIVFTDANSGCSANLEVEVFDVPLAMFTDEDVVCTGSSVGVTPNTGGSWTSSDVTIVTVDNLGKRDRSIRRYGQFGLHRF